MGEVPARAEGDGLAQRQHSLDQRDDFIVTRLLYSARLLIAVFWRLFFNAKAQSRKGKTFVFASLRLGV